ncbi:MAG TPA: hypothetical protein VHU77_11405 [Candidatus Limnocylindria bacterium]|jgi:hypothetical protein|nr:hypothetical protein [Candidatus Limnocylindria bacterium]
MTPLRHYRNGPEIDVALCGERDMPIFAASTRFITCPACIAKRAGLIARGLSRPRQQLVAEAKRRREMPASSPDFGRGARASDWKRVDNNGSRR